MTLTLSIPCSGGDCWGTTADGLVTGTTTLHIGGSPLGSNCWTWIPFTVNLGRNQKIVSARILWVATITFSSDVHVALGCEAADNPSTPVTLADLQGRVMTTAQINAVPGPYTAGVQYSEDTTGAVQEILNRAGWNPGQNMAVYAVDNGTPAGERRQLASTENATYQEPTLEIIYAPFVPRGSMF
jgi:hypothetical protein